MTFVSENESLPESFCHLCLINLLLKSNLLLRMRFSTNKRINLNKRLMRQRRQKLFLEPLRNKNLFTLNFLLRMSFSFEKCLATLTHQPFAEMNFLLTMSFWRTNLLLKWTFCLPFRIWLLNYQCTWASSSCEVWLNTQQVEEALLLL